MMMGTSLPTSCRMARVTAIPSISGIFQSMMQAK